MLSCPLWRHCNALRILEMGHSRRLGTHVKTLSRILNCGSFYFIFCSTAGLAVLFAIVLGDVQLPILSWNLEKGWHKVHYPLLRIFAVSCDKEHDDVITWRHLLRYWLFGRIHRSPMLFLHKGPVTWSFVRLNIRNSGVWSDLRRHGTHCDVTVMILNNMCIIRSNLLEYIKWKSVRRKIF